MLLRHRHRCFHGRIRHFEGRNPTFGVCHRAFLTRIRGPAEPSGSFDLCHAIRVDRNRPFDPPLSAWAPSDQPFDLFPDCIRHPPDLEPPPLMINEFANRQNMHRTVLAVLDDPAHKAVYENKPPAVFTAKATEYRALCSTLEQLMREQNAAITGAAERKEREEAELEDKAFEIGQALAAWFEDMGREDAAAEVDHSRSAWQRLRDEALLQRARLVLDRLQQSLQTAAEALAGYGLTPGDATALQKEIDDYAAVIGAPSNAIASRKALTQTLRPRFREASELLRGMDKLVLRFRSTDAGRGFADAWTAARIVRDLGRRSAQEDENAAVPSGAAPA